MPKAERSVLAVAMVANSSGTIVEYSGPSLRSLAKESLDSSKYDALYVPNFYSSIAGPPSIRAAAV